MPLFAGFLLTCKNPALQLSLQCQFAPLNARPLHICRIVWGTFSTEIQVSYSDKATTKYSEALLLFANLQFMRKAQYSVTCTHGHNYKNCLMFIIKDII